MTRPSGTRRPGEHSLSLIGDNRRRNPGTSLEPRRRGDIEPAPQAQADSGEAAVLRVRLRECTADLRRVKSEYDNYRRRVRRDRRAVGEIAVANVLTRFLPVLDAIDQARRARRGHRRLPARRRDTGNGTRGAGTASPSARRATPSTPPCTRPSPAPSPTTRNSPPHRGPAPRLPGRRPASAARAGGNRPTTGQVTATVRENVKVLLEYQERSRRCPPADADVDALRRPPRRRPARTAPWW